MKLFGNVTKLEALIDSADALIQADCEVAGIKTATRDGKTIPISEASISEKYTALRSANPPGTNLEERANLLSSNSVIATRCEKAESDLAISQTNVGTLTRENASLKETLSTAQASVTTLTEEKSNQINLRDAAVKENSRLDKELSSFKAGLAQDCIDCGCLDLKGEDGKALPATATAEQKLAAASKFSTEDLRKAYKGAIHSAASKVGLNLSAIPGNVPQALGGNQAGILAQYASEKARSSQDGVAFYRKNSEAIDAALRIKK